MTPGFPLRSLQTLPNTTHGSLRAFPVPSVPFNAPLARRDLQTFPRPSVLAVALCPQLAGYGAHVLRLLPPPLSL